MSDAEMNFWRARWELLPWGDHGHWWRHAVDRADLANLYRDKKKKRIPYKPTAFFTPHKID